MNSKTQLILASNPDDSNTTAESQVHDAPSADGDTAAGRLPAALASQSMMSNVRDARVQFTRYKEVTDAIRRCHASYDGVHRPRSMQLYGTTGVGKSYLLQEYAAKFPRVYRGDAVEIPVLYIRIPSAPTNKSLATQLLKALGAPSPESGSSSAQFDRFVMLARQARVQLIIFDEMHHFIDRGQAKSHAKVTDALKMVVEELNVPCVAAGAPRSKALFDLNAQLRSRFAFSLRMHPFSIRTAPELSQLLGFLKALRAKADPRLHELLVDKEFAVGMFFATDGILRQIIDVICDIDVAVKNGAQPSMETAAKLFAELHWPAVPFDRNPFNQLTFSGTRLNKPGEPYEPALYDGDNHPGDVDCFAKAA